MNNTEFLSTAGAALRTVNITAVVFILHELPQLLKNEIQVLLRNVKSELVAILFQGVDQLLNEIVTVLRVLFQRALDDLENIAGVTILRVSVDFFQQRLVEALTKSRMRGRRGAEKECAGDERNDRDASDFEHTEG